MQTASPTRKPSPAPAVRPAPDWSAPVFVWGAWAVSLGALLWFVAQSGNDVPWSDDVYHVPVMIGQEPLTIDWLVRPYNNHFLPMVKVVLLLLWKLTGSFRGGMYFAVLVLGAVAAAMIRTAAKLRGSVAFTDAVFPLALVNFGHMENFLQNWGAIVYVLLVGLMCVALLVVVRSGRELTLTSAVVLGVCLVLLPLNGSPGLVFIPGLVAWLAWWGVIWWRAGTPAGRRDALVAWSFVLAAVLTVPLSFYYLSGEKVPDRPPVPTILSNASRVLAQMFGSAAPNLWPATGVLAACVLCGGVAYLLAQSRRRPGEWRRGLGLLAALAGFVLIALAIGAGRPSEECSAMRFALFVCPALCGLYFVGVLFPEPPLGRLLQMGLFCGTCLFFYGNVKRGYEFGAWIHQSLDAFENDLRSGLPCDLLADRYTYSLILMGDERAGTGQAEQHAAWVFRLLRDKQIGIFTQLKDLPDHWEVPVPVQPTAVKDVVPENGAWVGTGGEADLAFNLGTSRKVYAIRLTCTIDPKVNDKPSGQFTVRWRRTDLAGNPEREERFPLEGKFSWDEVTNSRRPFTLSAWVDGDISQFRLSPDTKPFVLQIAAIVLLVPPGSPANAGALP